MFKDEVFCGYVFGTMHVRDNSAFRWIDQIRGRINECDIYAAEMDLGAVDPVRLSNSSTLKSGQSIREWIPETKYEKMLAQIKKSFDLNVDSLRFLHPFLIISRLSEAVLSDDHLHALDHYLYQYALKVGKETTGLETFEEQMQIMEELDPKDHVKGILQIARDPVKFRTSIRNLVRHYEQQDLQALYQVSRKQLHHLRSKMLFDRNHVFTERIVTLTQRGKLFAAFGAAHLGGAQGVIRLLKRSGFRLIPITIVPCSDTKGYDHET